MTNVHDMHAMQTLAGCFHESGHAVVALACGERIKKVSRYETITLTPKDATPVARATVCFAGAAAVARFDNGQGKHDAEDSGDLANVAKLGVTPVDAELARASAAVVVAEHWQNICDVSFELFRSPNGELTPERVEAVANLHPGTPAGKP